MSRPLVRLTIVGFALTALAWGGEAAAMSFRVSPVKIFLDGKQRTETLEVRNQSERAITIQASAVKWTQDEQAKDSEVETDDVIFYPKIFTVAQGKTQILRVGLKKPLPGDQEQAYRLYLSELPEPKLKDDKKEPGVRILLRAGLPLFLAPREPLLEGSVVDLTAEQCNITFAIQNAGNVNFQVIGVHVALIDELGKTLQSTERKGWYVLAGKRKPFKVEMQPGVCPLAQKVVVSVDSDKLKLHAESLARGGIEPGP